MPAAFATAVALVLGAGFTARGAPAGESPAEIWRGLPASERDALRDRYRAFLALPPGARDELRRRLAAFQSLSPEDRAIVERRYAQLQSLPPEERRQIEAKLDGFDGIDPFGFDSFVRSVQRYLDAGEAGRQQLLDVAALWQRKQAAHRRKSAPAARH